MGQGGPMAGLGYTVVVRFIIGLLSGVGATISALAAFAATADLEHCVHGLVNEHRVSRGLKPLAFNSGIAAVARGHSRDMATGRVEDGHEGFDSRRRAVAAIIPLRSFGENVAWSRASGIGGPVGEGLQCGREEKVSMGQAAVVRYVVEGWLSSPGHRKNIEGSDYELTGIGAAQGPNGAYSFTQLFVRAKSDYPGTSGSDTPYTRSVPATRERKSEPRVVDTWLPDGDTPRPGKPRREKDPRKRPGRKRTADGWAQTLD